MKHISGDSLKGRELSLFTNIKLGWKIASLNGRELSLSTNIKLGWKSLPRINTLAYYEHS